MRIDATTRRHTWRLLCALLLLAAMACPAVADPVPPLMNYQGRLVREDVGPVNGTVSLKAALYAAPAPEIEFPGLVYVLYEPGAAKFPHSNIAPGSVTALPPGGGDAYAEGEDYWIDYERGWIHIIPGGALEAGQSVEVSYWYIPSSLWSETHADVEVRNGLYHILLGSVVPLQAEHFAGDAVYLSVSVDGEELLPRQRIASVAYAFKAADAARVGGKSIADLGTVRRVEAGPGLTVENPDGPTVTVRLGYPEAEAANPFMGLVPPDGAYPTGNVFHMDFDNGSDDNDGLSPEAAFKTWEHIFVSGTGVVYDVEGPVKVYLHTRNDPAEPIDLGPIAVKRERVAIVGVNFPVITSPLCAMTVCGPNCIIVGLRVYHPNGNGIHVTPNQSGTYVPNGTVVAGNIFLDGGIGASIAIDASDVLATHNRINDTNFGVMIGGIWPRVKRVTVCHNTISGGRSAGIYFLNADKCVSHDNRVSFATKGVWFNAASQNCRSLNDIVDLGPAGFTDDGTGNIIWTPQQ